MKFARYTFLIAAIYDILVLPPLYFQIEKIGRDDPPPITHPEFYYGFIGVALFWQLAFLIIAYDPVKYRAMMIPGILEKLAFVIPAVLLFFGGNLSTLLFGAAMIDFAHSILFVVAYFKTPAE